MVKMSFSVRTIIGWTLMTVGCCALAFVAFLAWLSRDTPGAWFQLPELQKEVRFDAVISAVIGASAIVLGLLLRRVRRSSDLGSVTKRIP